MQRTRTAHWLAILLCLTLLALLLRMLATVLVPAALGALFAALVDAPHQAVRRRLGRFEGAAAGAVTGMSVVLILLPLFFLVVGAVKAVRALSGERLRGVTSAVREELATPLAKLDALGRYLGTDLSADSVGDNVPDLLRSIAERVGAAATATPTMMLGGFIFLMAVFFCLRDGRRGVAYLVEVLPFENARCEQLVRAAHAAVRGVVLASILSGVVQSALLLLSFVVFDVPGAVVWAMLAFFMSFIPMIGTVPVTTGGTLYLFLCDRPGAGVGMAIAAVIIGTSDNFVRPLAQGMQSKMHPLYTVLAIFGGLELFGASGVFLGPVFAAIAQWAAESLVALSRQEA
jgi:predicted PurR-regulated permease PerM